MSSSSVQVCAFEVWRGGPGTMVFGT